MPECLFMLQLMDDGGTWWSGPFTARQLPGVYDDYERMGVSVIDEDHAHNCPGCQE